MLESIFGEVERLAVERLAVERLAVERLAVERLAVERNQEVVDFFAMYLVKPTVEPAIKKACNWQKASIKLQELPLVWSLMDEVGWRQRRSLRQKLRFKTPCGKCQECLKKCELVSSLEGQGEPSRIS